MSLRCNYGIITVGPLTRNWLSNLKRLEGRSLSILASRIDFREFRSCVNAEPNQVSSYHKSTPKSLLPIFGRKAFFYLPRFKWESVSPMESFVGYADYLRISPFAWNLNRLLKNVKLYVKNSQRQEMRIRFKSLRVNFVEGCKVMKPKHFCKNGRSKAPVGAISHTNHGWSHIQKGHPWTHNKSCP